LAKWDLSKLPEGRKPLPDEWFRERAQMQERIAELEAKMAGVLDFYRRLERFAEQSGDSFLLEKSQEAIAELKGESGE
jgi:aspartate/tyrosine/aromatic aminotransferase